MPLVRKRNKSSSCSLATYKCASIEIEDVEKQLYLSDNDLEQIVSKMTYEMKKGLSKDTNPDATIKMLPSFARSPTGMETGSFMALDLGGTNFRVLLVTISSGDDGQAIDMDSQIYKVPEEIMVMDGEALFDHIASCMADFLRVVGLEDQSFDVGFTFSFPCTQHSIKSATLLSWTKGFNCANVEGEDVVMLLEKALKKRGEINVRIVAIVNDTVGTLVSCGFSEPDTKIGLIVGTGSNACYIERNSNIELIEENDGEMIVNMEWGAFGDDGALDEYRNEYDQSVDEASLNRGKQKFEKMISGMYLGEIVRLCLCKLTDQNVIFRGVKPEVLLTPGCFQSSFVSDVENAIEEGMVAVQNVLASLGICQARGTDCAIVVRVCQAVSNRAANLCSVGIAAVARKIKENHPETEKLVMTCGVDGTLYKKHPTFSKKVFTKVQQLVMDHDIDVQFVRSYDGSGKGAALVAATCV